MKRFQKFLGAVVVSGICLSIGVNETVGAENVAVPTVGPSTGGATLTAANPGTSPALSYNARYLLKQYQSGISQDTLLSYINSSKDGYSLNAQDVAYFQSAGVPATLTEAMTDRDTELQEYSAAKDLAQAASQAGVENAFLLDPDTVAIDPSAPPPDVTVIGSGSSYDASPGYGVDSGSYVYNGGPVIIGGGAVWGGLGWGGRHHGGFRADGGFHHGGFAGGIHHGGFSGGGWGGHVGGHR
jgi:hypothetical protein